MRAIHRDEDVMRYPPFPLFFTELSIIKAGKEVEGGGGHPNLGYRVPASRRIQICTRSQGIGKANGEDFERTEALWKALH